MAEAKHDVDYSAPEEEVKQKVDTPLILTNLNVIDWTPRSWEGHWRRAGRVHLQDEGQAVQTERWLMEGKRNWQCQTLEEQGNQENQIRPETREDPQACC